MAANHRTGPAANALSAKREGRLHGIRLARRAARGDRRAFEQIFKRHHQELYRYCLAIVRDPDDAEDALQATMASALRGLRGEDRDIDIRPWLFRIAHNESVSLLRRRPPDTADDLEVPEQDGATQEDRLETRDRLRTLVADLNELPERQRSALVMRELSGLSYAEIADALQCSQGGARQAVFEARTALREREEGRGMECEEIRRAISERDGRRLRGRKLRAHLGGCDGCRAFAAAIPARRADLGSLCPPLPAIAAGTMLTGLLGGAGGGAATGAGAAGIAGGGIAASAAIKGGSIAAAIALAVGAADVGGLIDLPSPVAGGGQSSANDSRTDPGSPVRASGHTAGGEASRAGAGANHGSADPKHPGGGGPGHQGGDSPGSSGSAAAAPQSSGEPSALPGNSGSAPGQSGTAPGGGSAEAPGQTGVMPGNASSAPGHSATSPGNSAAAPGQTDAQPPGHVDNPGSANGNGASAGPKPK